VGSTPTRSTSKLEVAGSIPVISTTLTLILRRLKEYGRATVYWREMWSSNPTGGSVPCCLSSPTV
jgi:hypothetical protein